MLERPGRKHKGTLQAHHVYEMTKRKTLEINMAIMNM
jgi:hypothetical protein